MLPTSPHFQPRICIPHFIRCRTRIIPSASKKLMPSRRSRHWRWGLRLCINTTVIHHVHLQLKYPTSFSIAAFILFFRITTFASNQTSSSSHPFRIVAPQKMAQCHLAFINIHIVFNFLTQKARPFLSSHHDSWRQVAETGGPVGGVRHSTKDDWQSASAALCHLSISCLWQK